MTNLRALDLGSAVRSDRTAASASKGPLRPEGCSTCKKLRARKGQIDELSSSSMGNRLARMSGSTNPGRPRLNLSVSPGDDRRSRERR